MPKCLLILLLLFAASKVSAQNIFVKRTSEREVVLLDAYNNLVRITAFGSSVIRFQFAAKGKDFLPYNYREMVASYDWTGSLLMNETSSTYEVSTELARAIISKKDLSVLFYNSESTMPLLISAGNVQASGDSLFYQFKHDTSEHFAGLGHDYMGRLESLDLRGKRVSRNYAHNATRFTSWKYSQQAPLIVPFFLSSKGYGIFLNSTFTNFFNFGADGLYEMGIDTHGEHGEIDFFFMAGPGVKDVVEQYTDLTGKPRLPQLSVLGLQLSDKVHDHSSKTPSDENWWKEKVKAHRSLGLAIDHLVNDNRWRAQGGQRCISIFEWDKERFPDPSGNKRWLQQNGLTITLDWNRCISAKSYGWKKEYNLQGDIPFHEFAESAPDFSLPATRAWIWNLFKTKAIDTTLHYPIDGLWIDEVDEMYTIPYKHQMAVGKWGEDANYWFMFIAKALVQQGWDKYIGAAKRPYVWMRGATAGTQRYATMWSGDIDTDFEEMGLQIRGMQSAGISGFAFWGHDAGGFIDHSGKRFKGSPNDTIYARWSMQMGAFSPIWKPHGMGQSRWPEDRSALSKAVAERYIRLRYQLMPYLYSYAHIATTKGLPIVRPMLLEYPNEANAWKFDTQFMFGGNMLVAPAYRDSQNIWLPNGKWYYYWSDKETNGGQVLQNVTTPINELPLWIKAGSIIPMYDYALSTFDINKEKLTLHVYPGADGHFTLLEDDGVTENFRKGEMMETEMKYDDEKSAFTIFSPKGNYTGAPRLRQYVIVLHGIEKDISLKAKSNISFKKSHTANTLILIMDQVKIEQEIRIQF